MEPATQIDLSISVREFVALTGPREPVVITSDQTVEAALEILAGECILSAPVVMAKSEDSVSLGMDGWYLGTLDVQQLLLHLVRQVREKKQGGEMDAEMLHAAVDQLFSTKLTSMYGNDSGIAFPAWLDKSLKELIEEGFLTGVPGPNQLAHRVVICDHQCQVETLISQSDIVRFVAEHPSCLEPGVLDKSLEELNYLLLGKAKDGGSPREVVAVNQKVTAIEAFELMESSGVSGIAILGEEGQLVGNLSASDLRGIGRGEFGLLMSVEDFVLVNKDEVGCFALSPTDTLGCLLRDFSEKRVHRLYVVDNQQAPLAVVTLTDVMRFLAHSGVHTRARSHRVVDLESD
eukprot:TRINITY_DN1059_c0_g1_i12.p1 TRINITY_DN1059_c0_g1~~TRINITY_DN1059_c0_g1_i12.p1  ORF type:complete len:347 (+),score=84.82 TRINITY_DN1059_c0_g1_i12:191-1231(+)